MVYARSDSSIVVEQAGENAEGVNYYSMVNDLRGLAVLLKKLEDHIAIIAAKSGKNGYTAPGSFLFEFFSKINLTVETQFMMTELLGKAKDLLADEAVQQGHK